MKIVHIITRLIVGGAQENTLITCKLLAQRGHDVTLITGPAIGPEGQLFTKTQGQLYGTYVIREMCRPIAPVKDYITYYRLKGMLDGIRPDIVHTHSAKAGILGRYAAYNMGKYRPKIVHSVHGLSFHPYQNAWLNKLYITLEQAAAKKTDHFITVADTMTAQSRAAGIGLDKPYTTAYSAIDEEGYYRTPSAKEKQDFRIKYNIASDAVVFICVARLFKLKGHNYIIECARQLVRQFPQVIWLFVGNGSLARKYAALIKQMGLSDYFRFTGLLEPQEVPIAIHASDILIHCSLREGLARTLPQAMLCKKPVISFDVDGAREVVNENTGRLIEPKNIEQLSQACTELITDKNLREQLGQNAQQLVHDKFAPETMTDTIEGIYRLLA